MAAPLVDPVVVPLGQDVHVAFVDQNGNPLPTGAEGPDAASVFPNPTGNPPLPNGVVTITIDADKRGVTFHAIGTGSGWVYANVTKGNTIVQTTQFRVTVPWSVTQLGTVLA